MPQFNVVIRTPSDDLGKTTSDWLQDARRDASQHGVHGKDRRQRDRQRRARAFMLTALRIDADDAESAAAEIRRALPTLARMSYGVGATRCGEDSPEAVRCEICGESFVRIGAHVREEHGITVATYRNKYPGAYCAGR